MEQKNAGWHFPASIFLTNVGEVRKSEVRKVCKDGKGRCVCRKTASYLTALKRLSDFSDSADFRTSTSHIMHFAAGKFIHHIFQNGTGSMQVGA